MRDAGRLVLERAKQIQERLAQGESPEELAKELASWEETLEDFPSLIDELVKSPDPKVAHLLGTLLSSRSWDKGKAKAIKRGLFKLRQRGVRWEEKREGRGVLRPAPPPQFEGYLGAIDSRGHRVVAIHRSRPLGMGVLYWGIVSDEEGMLRFERMEGKKKALSRFLSEELSSESFPVVEAPAGYCLGVLEEAEGISKERARPLPQAFKPSLGELQGVKRDDSTALIYRFLSDREVRGLLREAKALFSDIPTFSTWFLPQEEIEPFAQAIREAQTSRLILTPQQKQERIGAILTDALRELFDERRRLLYKKRLEEMAYVIWKEGKKREAKVTLAVALDLERPPSPLDPNPFLWELLNRSLALSLGEMCQEERPLIVTP